MAWRVFHFGSESERQLATCDERLQRVLRRAIQISPVDFSVREGFRGEVAQNRAFESGHSEKRWPDGKHNRMVDGKPCSLAADCTPVPLDWNDREQFVYMSGAIMTAAKELDIPLRWGGDWNGDTLLRPERFRDYGHVELILE